MDKKFIKDKIMLTGGGTAGSVTPLLAMAENFHAEKSRTRICLGWKC